MSCLGLLIKDENSIWASCYAHPKIIKTGNSPVWLFYRRLFTSWGVSFYHNFRFRYLLDGRSRNSRFLGRAGTGGFRLRVSVKKVHLLLKDFQAAFTLHPWNDKGSNGALFHWRLRFGVCSQVSWKEGGAGRPAWGGEETAWAPVCNRWSLLCCLWVLLELVFELVVVLVFKLGLTTLRAELFLGIGKKSFCLSFVL